MNAKAKIQAQLSAYLDGELEEAQLRQVEDALENDGELRAELADLAAARKLLRDLPAEKPPIDLVSRVLAEAERSQLVGAQAAESSPDTMRWVRYAASAAVLLVAATVGIVVAFTICSPNIYKDNLAHHGNPDKRGDIRDDTTSVAVIGGKRTDADEDVVGDGLGRLAIRGLPTNGPVDDVRELKQRGLDMAGGGGAGGHFINGKPGTVDDNGRSGTLVLSGGSEPRGTCDGVTTGNGGALTLSKNGDALTLSHGGEGNLFGSNTYTGVTTVVAGTQAKSGAGTLILGDTLTGNDGGALAKGQAKNNADAVSGPFDNVDNMSRVLAGNTTNNTIIYTDRLGQTQQQIEKLLIANGIASVTATQSEASAPMGKAASQAPQARGNVYVANTLSPAQVQYEAYVTPEQLAKVQKDLDRLRARQNVSQDVPALAYNEANAKNRDYSYKQDQAGKDEVQAGKESAKLAGIALARADGDSGLRRKMEAESESPVAKAISPVIRAARPAREPAQTPPPAATTAGPAPAAEPVAPAAPAPAAPVAESAPPAPVVVAPGGARGEEAGRKAKNDVRTPAKDEDKLAEVADKADSQLAVVSAKPDAQLAKTPASGSGSAAEPRGQPANEPLAIRARTHLEFAQTQPATPAAKSAPEGVEVALAPSVRAKPGGDGRSSAPAWSVAAKPSETPAPNAAAKPGGPRAAATSGEKSAPLDAKAGDPADSEGRQLSAIPTERMGGQAAGPVDGQRATGIFNPPPAPPTPTSAPATQWQQQQVVQAPPDQKQAQLPIMEHGERGEPVVQVGIVKQSPLTQSEGGTVDVRFATPPGQAGQTNQVERGLATANVQKLVITLNYRQAGEAGVNVGLDRAARISAAASQTAPAQAAQESK